MEYAYYLDFCRRCLFDKLTSVAGVSMGRRHNRERPLTTAGGGRAGVLTTHASSLPISDPVGAWNPMFIRQNLISGFTMERIGRIASKWVNGWTMPCVLVLWFVAAIAAMANWQTIWTFSQKLFVPDSLLWWVAAWGILKMVHEIGHAAIAVKYGCRIQSAGLCWMFFSPVPFVDVSGMWLNTSRLQRCLCCLGGLIFELTLSSIAVLVFLTSDIDSVRYASCMLFTMGAFTSIVVNGTPFMKFDGYHVLSEWLAWPNLYADGQLAFQQLQSRIVKPWARPKKSPPTLLVIYGLLCAFYRFTFWLALLLGAFHTFHALGLFVVGSLIVALVIAPRVRNWIRCIRRNDNPGQSALTPWQSLSAHRYTILWTGFVTLFLCFVISWLPAPWTPMVPAFVDYCHPHLLRNETDGFVSEVFVRPGDRVQRGDVLAVLNNPDMEQDKKMKELEVVSLREQAMLLQSQQSLAESQSVKAKLDAAQEQLEQLEQKTAALTLRSPCDGRVVDSSLHERIGQFLKPGEDLGMITENEQLEVVGFVGQADLDWFRSHLSRDVRIRIPEGSMASANLSEVAPRASEYLESSQLAANFGGPLSVEIENAEDGSTRWRLPKPRFKIKAKLSASHADLIRPGQSVGLYMPGDSVSILRSLMRLGEQYWDHSLRQSKTN